MKNLLFFLATTLIFLSCEKDEEGFPVTTDFEGKFVFIGSSDPHIERDEVFTLDKNGSKQLTFNDTIGYAKYDPIWIKNGEYIHYRNSEICLCPSFGNNKLIRADGSDPRDFFMSAISPNAQYGVIAGGGLYFFSLDPGFNTTRIDSLVSTNLYQHVKWSPNSEHILFTVSDVTHNKLGIYNITSHWGTILFGYAESVDPITEAEWNYTGDKVAFIWNDDIQIVSADGPHIPGLPTSTNIETEIAWSPTEDVLAYCQRSLDGKTVDIILYDVTNFSEVPLNVASPINEHITSIHWPSDGSQIAFSSSSQNPGIYIVNRDGTNLRRVHDEYVYEFDWYTE